MRPGHGARHRERREPRRGLFGGRESDEADRDAPRAALRRGESASFDLPASSRSDEVAGGLFFDFESLKDVGAVAACQRERGRVDGVVMIIRASTRRVTDSRRAGLAASSQNICYICGRLPSVYATLLEG